MNIVATQYWNPSFSKPEGAARCAPACAPNGHAKAKRYARKYFLTNENPNSEAESQKRNMKSESNRKSKSNRQRR